MRIPLSRIIMTTSAVSAMLLATIPSPANAAKAEPVAVPVPASVGGAAVGSVGGAVGVDNTASPSVGVGTQATCFFQTWGDYVHVSSSAFEASGHGWWVNLNCPAGTLARVTVILQELYSDGSFRTKGVPGVATVRSGGGSGARATGRAPCADATLTGWRSVVDVDLIGIPDDPGVTITPTINVSCRVY